MSSALRVDRVRTQLDGLAASGLDVATFSHAAIELLQRAVPFSAACFASLDPSTHLVTDTFKLAISDERDPEWAHYEYETDDVAKFIDLALRPNPVTTVEIETEGDSRRSLRMREFMQPNWSLGHELRAGCRINGEAWGAFCLFRDEGPGGFSAAEVDFIAGVAPTIASGMRLGAIARAATGELSSVTGPAVLIIGSDDEPMQVSPEAAQRLSDLAGRSFDIWGGLPMPLLSLVSSARAHGQGRYPHPPRVRLRTPAGQWLVAHASLLAGRDGDRGSVVITIEEARPPEIVPLVVAAFGLSARERDVVQLVLQGIDTAEIARTLHLSSYTVQDHLKSIFVKADVRSRRELMAKVFFDHYADRMGSGIAPNGWFAAPSPALADPALADPALTN